MEERVSLQQNLFAFLKNNKIIVGLFALGMMFLMIGLIQFILPKPTTIEFKKGAEVEAASTFSEKSQIVVDVGGEVVKPGVYTLDSTARVQDALDAAGGLSSFADSSFVAKSINLALPIQDGTKIYIPKVGEISSSLNLTTAGIIQGELSGSKGNNTPGVISINSSSQSELEALPGIGPVTAGKIISNRPYSSIDDLLTKKAVGQSTFNKIKDQIGL